MCYGENSSTHFLFPLDPGSNQFFVVVGFIFETEIVSGEDSRFFQASLEQYVKQVRRSLEFISFLLFTDQVKSNLTNKH